VLGALSPENATIAAATGMLAPIPVRATAYVESPLWTFDATTSQSPLPVYVMQIARFAVVPEATVIATDCAPVGIEAPRK